MQTKEGFDQNLPPVRLSVEQRKSIMEEFENFDDIAESEPQEVVGPPHTLGERFSNAVDNLMGMVDQRAKFPSDFFHLSE